ncbi:MAG: DUF4054 domain-containing protein [Planctomycetes bacterium]|nr:DUF4054 domain-containing protein [Planctomycetota bacterium]
MVLLAEVEATWTDVLRVSRNAPDIALFTETIDREFFLNMAGRRFKEDQYDEFRLEIQAYATAHFAQMAFTEAAGLGPKSSESIGGISASFTLPVLNTDEHWGETIFGRMVKKIMAQTSFPQFIVVNPGIV